MGKKRRTFTAEFKMKAIEMYLHRGMGSKRIGKELDITYSIVDRWIAHYKKEGLIGLQKKRGKASGVFCNRKGFLRIFGDASVFCFSGIRMLKN